MIASILITSFLLECILSNFFSPVHAFCYPLFVTSALILIFPYFKNRNKYLLVCAIYGLVYDIVASPIFFFHTFLFFLLAIVLLLLNEQWNNNIINNILFQIILLLIYETFFYVMIAMIDNISWNSILNFQLIGKSIVLNIFYIAGMYYATDKISQKYKIDKID